MIQVPFMAPNAPAYSEIEAHYGRQLAMLARTPRVPGHHTDAEVVSLIPVSIEHGVDLTAYAVQGGALKALLIDDARVPADSFRDIPEASDDGSVTVDSLVRRGELRVVPFMLPRAGADGEMEPVQRVCVAKRSRDLLNNPFGVWLPWFDHLGFMVWTGVLAASVNRSLFAAKAGRSL